MLRLTKQLRLFLRHEGGSIATLSAFAAIAIVGAAGVGIDTFRLQSARTALRQVVGLTCNRVSTADYGIYPNNTSLIAMGQKYSADQILKTALTPSTTSVGLASNSSGNIVITGTSTVAATLTKIFGDGSLSANSTATCAPPSQSPPGACSKTALIYRNPGSFTLTNGTTVNGQSSYVANVVSSAGLVKTRLLVGGSYGNTGAVLNGSATGDIVVLQNFNGDGSIPAPCNPNLNPPSNGGGVCTAAIVKQLELGLGLSTKDDQYANPTLAAAISNGSLTATATTGATVQVPVTSDFVTTTRLDSDPTAVSDFLQNIADTVLDVKGTHQINYSNGALQDLTNGGFLYRIMNGDDSVWAVNNVCEYAISPIVLDLIGMNEIKTTGPTSARSILPHRLGPTVRFDLLANGGSIATEWLVGNGQAFLVDNRDGKAAENMNGRRLFGNVDGYANGYEKLALLDKDGDGKLTGPELEGLAAWIDDGDGVVQPGELKSLAEVGVTELSVTVTAVRAERGRTHLRSTGVHNGKTMLTEDVFFAMDVGSLVKAQATPDAAVR